MGKLKQELIGTKCPHCGEVGSFDYEPAYGGYPGSREEPPEPAYAGGWFCTACGEPHPDFQDSWDEEDQGDWEYDCWKDRQLDREEESE